MAAEGERGKKQEMRGKQERQEALLDLAGVIHED
jgi:hypothetical protein